MKTIPIAKFEKVSWEQFKADCDDCGIRTSQLDEPFLREIYDSIRLPERATAQAAGYDFYLPFTSMTFLPGITKRIPTGIRCKMLDGWVLMLYPRSGLGFKNGFRLNNTTGIIDGDYYGAKNEGHIMASVSVAQGLSLRQGDRFMQGVFLQYGTAEEEEVTAERTGGFGSTGG